MSSLSGKEAFLAMFAFLEDRYNMTQSDDLGGLLGDMSLLSEGNTADPAVWDDWCAAVEKAKDGQIDARQTLRKK